MSRTRERGFPRGGRVLVLAPNWLGDAVMALPALADVRRHLQPSRMIVAARGPVAGLFHLAPVADEVVTLAWRGDVRRPGALRADVRLIRRCSADLAILLPNSFASAALAWLARIPARWGYAADLRGPLLTRAVPRPAGSRHQGRYYQHLVEACGVAAGPLEPVLSVPPAATAAARDLLRVRGWDGGPFVVLAPGAAYGTAKRWPAESFAAVAAEIASRAGASCVLIGSGADAAATAAVHAGVPDGTRARVIDVTGATTLETLAGVLALADACVTNDSGAMHLAAAVGVPLAALFGPTREHETAPLARQGVRADVLVHPVPCRPCMLRDCPIDHRCMTGMPPERVYDVVADLLATRRVEMAPARAPRGDEAS